MIQKPTPVQCGDKQYSRTVRWMSTLHVCKLDAGHKGRHKCLRIGQDRKAKGCNEKWNQKLRAKPKRRKR